MSRIQAQGLMPSVLDRLIDPQSSGVGQRHGYDMQQAVDAVRRDLEELLNTHQVYLEGLPDWPEVSKSILTYGMPDMASTEAFSAAQRAEVGKMIEEAIALYEPRLKNVRARLVETKDKGAHSVRFHIEAQLNMDPAPEVAFETVLELTTGHTTIKPREAES